MPAKEEVSTFLHVPIKKAHQAGLLVSSTPGSDPQSIFEVLGHVVVGHDVVQHSGDNRVKVFSACSSNWQGQICFEFEREPNWGQVRVQPYGIGLLGGGGQ